MGEQCKFPVARVSVRGGDSAVKKIVEGIKKTKSGHKFHKIIGSRSIHILAKHDRTKLQKRCLDITQSKAYCAMHSKAVRISGLAEVAAKEAIKKVRGQDCSQITPKQLKQAIELARKVFASKVDLMTYLKIARR